MYNTGSLLPKWGPIDLLLPSDQEEGLVLFYQAIKMRA